MVLLQDRLKEAGTSLKRIACGEAFLLRHLRHDILEPTLVLVKSEIVEPATRAAASGLRRTTTQDDPLGRNVTTPV
jgi:hypothetical protein